jgi:hypothetical protein
MARAFNASDLTFTDLPLVANFGDNYTAPLATLQQTRPLFCTILSGIETNAAARFDALLHNDPASDFLTGRQAADILNIMTAMSDINLRVGKALDSPFTATTGPDSGRAELARRAEAARPRTLTAAIAARSASAHESGRRRAYRPSCPA